ncbi:MAG: hypothetical protein WC974_09045 [Thermoplasmata archaeon]
MTIQTLKQELTGMLHGSTLNKVRNFYDLCKRASGNILLKIDPAETRRIANLTNAIHDDIYDYTAPSDLKRVIDIRPQVNRDSSDNFSQWFAEEFDKYKDSWDDIFQIRHNDGTKSLRVSKNISPSPITVHGFNSLTDNGTIAIVGTASGLKVDTLHYVTGNKSIEFDLAVTGDGIQITGMSAIDLTDHDEISEHFIRVYLDSVSALTSITPIWGNDLTANYWTGVAQTAQADGTAFRIGWNIIKIPWNTAVETGTVAPATIDSLKLTFTITAAITNVRIDLWTSSIGEIFEIEYYSKYLFRSSAGTWLETPTADTDIINLDSDTYNIFTYECLIECAQQLQGSDSAFDITFAQNKLKELYDLQKENAPTEKIRPQTRYYKI